MVNVAPSAAGAGGAPESRRLSWQRTRELLERRPYVSLFGGFLLLLLAVLPPGNVSGDGASMLAVTRSLVEHDSVAIPCSFTSAVGRNGQCYSTFYPLNSILATPFFALGDALGHAAHVSPTFVGNAMAQVLPLLCAAFSATLTVAFARRMGASPIQAALAGLTLIFATEMACYERTFWAEPLLTALLSLQLWLFHRSNPSRWLLPAVIALSILAKPQAILVAPLLGLDLAWSARSWRPLIPVAWGTAVGAVLYGVYDDMRFSSFTNLGGSSRSLHANVFTAHHVISTIGLLTISPGRGLFIYSPICILGVIVCVRRWANPLARSALILMVALLIVYLGDTADGFSWASRYFTPALPLLVAAAWSTIGRARIVAAVLSVIGAIIELPTFIGFFQRYLLSQVNHHVFPGQLAWSIVRSPLVRVWGSMISEAKDAASTNLHLLTGSTGSGDAVQNQHFYHVVSEWWWMVPLAHVPRLVGALVALALAAAGLYLVRSWSRRRTVSPLIAG